MQKENFLIRHARNITIISCIGIISCITIIIITSLKKDLSKATYLSLQFAPSNAILTLEDGTELHTGTYEVSPGTYSGTLNAKGFQSKNIAFDVQGRQTNSITDYLVHSDNGLAYFEKSASDISTLRLIQNSPEIVNFLETYDRKASIYDKLPFYATWQKYPNTNNDPSTFTVTIADGNNHSECTTTLCLLITGPKNNYDQVTKTLSEKGYSIDNYEVLYEYSAV